MPDQARFLDFMDMIDGGGKGRMGDKFEDGGIFSALANLIATPYGSEDAGRKAKREAAYRAAGLLAPEEAEAAPIAAPAVRRTKPTREELMSARAAEMERQRGLQQDVFDPRNQQGATSFRVPVAPEYRSMDQAVGGAQYPSMYRSMDSVVGGMGAPNLPRPVATTAALSPTGSTASGVAPVPPMSEQLPPIAPATPMMPAPSIPTGMNLPQDAMMSRAMAALRQRFPNATPEQLANAAAMMGM
jgi:hypothetical protein